MAGGDEFAFERGDEPRCCLGRGVEGSRCAGGGVCSARGADADGWRVEFALALSVQSFAPERRGAGIRTKVFELGQRKMKPELQIKAIAELGGFYFGTTDSDSEECWRYENGKSLPIVQFPDYLNSRDAIVPVIEKQMKSYGDELRFWTTCQQVVANGQPTPYSIDYRCIIATPSQLCEALLRATGRYVED